jgi:hypothetical protein
MGDCSADITVQSFSGDGSISFLVRAACADSAGLFSYEYNFEDVSGNQQNNNRNQTWLRTHGENSILVEDIAPVSGGRLLSISITAISCQCYDL